MGRRTFDAWYRSEHPRLVRALTVVGAPDAEVAEVVDEAFVRAYERWDRVGTMASPAGWTYRTALNLLRRRWRRASIEMWFHLRASPRPVEARPADWSPEVWAAIASLPQRERTALALKYVADLSTEDIATAMGVASGTVGSTLHNARRRLAAELGDSRDTTLTRSEVRDA